MDDLALRRQLQDKATDAMKPRDPNVQAAMGNPEPGMPGGVGEHVTYNVLVTDEGLVLLAISRPVEVMVMSVSQAEAFVSDIRAGIKKARKRGGANR